MQDVCISFWNGKQKGEGQSDMILKVTDVCSTDPNDPTHCAKPGDIKIDRSKAKIMELIPGDGDVKGMKQVNGDKFKDGISDATSETWWFFTKCWADALVQPAYTDNWFAQPPIPNNLDWSQQTGLQQYKQNKIAYQKQIPKPWPFYPNGFYNATYVDIPITDWSPTEPDPKWCPIAGGKGWGIPTGDCGGGSNQGSPGTSPGTATSGTSPSSTSITPPGTSTSSTSTSSSSAQVPAGPSYPYTNGTTSSVTAAGPGASASPASSTPATSIILQLPSSSSPASSSTGAGIPSLTGSGTKDSAQQAKSGEGEDDTCEW